MSKPRVLILFDYDWDSVGFSSHRHRIEFESLGFDLFSFPNNARLLNFSIRDFIAGLKIAGGLSLIGAVVAEFTAGAAGKETGLASRILEASFRTEIPKMFAALVLVSLTGIMIYLVFMLVSKLVLGKWHESEIKSSR